MRGCFCEYRFFAGKVGKMGETIHVNDNTFEKVVLKSTLPVLVDFWAPWCAPCRAVAPVLERIAAEYDGRLLVVKVNVDDNPEWAGRYGVMSIPTLLLISEGNVADTRVGALPYNYLKQMVDQILAVASPAATVN
ncbi:MAG: trxA [Acidobacteria bacterium]|nr:trxA [Acidobacteriota bacterium]